MTAPRMVGARHAQPILWVPRSDDGHRPMRGLGNLVYPADVSEDSQQPRGVASLKQSPQLLCEGLGWARAVPEFLAAPLQVAAGHGCKGCILLARGRGAKRSVTRCALADSIGCTSRDGPTLQPQQASTTQPPPPTTTTRTLQPRPARASRNRGSPGVVQQVLQFTTLSVTSCHRCVGEDCRLALRGAGGPGGVNGAGGRSAGSNCKYVPCCKDVWFVCPDGCGIAHPFVELAARVAAGAHP